MTQLKMALKSLTAQVTQPWFREHQVMEDLLKMATKSLAAQAIHPWLQERQVMMAMMAMKAQWEQVPMAPVVLAVPQVKWVQVPQALLSQSLQYILPLDRKLLLCDLHLHPATAVDPLVLVRKFKNCSVFNISSRTLSYMLTDQS
jgi:hypothetical protein